MMAEEPDVKGQLSPSRGSDPFQPNTCVDVWDTLCCTYPLHPPIIVEVCDRQGRFLHAQTA